MVLKMMYKIKFGPYIFFCCQILAINLPEQLLPTIVPAPNPFPVPYLGSAVHISFKFKHRNSSLESLFFFNFQFFLNTTCLLVCPSGIWLLSIFHNAQLNTCHISLFIRKEYDHFKFD